MKRKPAFLIVVFVVIAGIFIISACKDSNSRQLPSSPAQANTSTQDCMKRVIALDDSLGKLRNHACEKISLAETIRNYADGLQKIDFSNCPADFTAAFEKHRQAWLQLIPAVEKYPDLRGEMHDLFDGLEHGKDADAFKPLVKTVWDTWEEIETVMKE